LKIRLKPLLSATGWIVAVIAIVVGIVRLERRKQKNERPLQFQWTHARDLGLREDLVSLGKELKMPLDQTEEGRALLDRFGSGEPMTHQDMEAVFQHYRFLALRAYQLAEHREAQLRERDEPPRAPKRVARELRATATQWTVTADGEDARFESYELLNRSDRPVRNVRLRVNGHPNWHSIGELAADAVKGADTDQEKATALYRFFEQNCFHNSATRGSEMLDPVKMFNVWGFGLCGDVSRCYVRMARRAGIEARAWNLRDHALAEARFDGGWHLFDVDIGTTFPLGEGGTPGSLGQVIAAGPDFVRSIYQPLVNRKMTETYVKAFQAKDRHEAFDLPPQPDEAFHTIRVDLAPRQAVRWTRANTGVYFTSNRWYRPTTFSNIRYEWHPTESRAALAVCRVQDLGVTEAEDGLMLAPPSGKTGQVEIPIATCYPLVDGFFVFRLEQGTKQEVKVAFQPGKRGWLHLTDKALRSRNKLTYVSLSPFFANGTGDPDYGGTLRITLSGNARLSTLELIAVGQIATASLPRLKAGTNRIAWSCEGQAPQVDLQLNWSETP